VCFFLDCGLLVSKNKGNDIRQMFDGIAFRYDFLNRLFSFGIDCWWRKKAILCLNVRPGQRILDMATGTGDVALGIARRYPQADSIVAADLSTEMLKRAVEKIRRASLTERIFPLFASCEEIPHPDKSFDGVIVAFGIRNVHDRLRALRELQRVLKPGGKMVVLEFSIPSFPPFRAVYHLYIQKILPLMAGFFSRREAYRYLPRSVAEFPPMEHFRLLMEKAGLEDVVQTPLTFGVATLHCATRGT